jgi:hypothetical protein
MAASRASAAGLSVEPEVGWSVFNGDMADLFDPGIEVGAAVRLETSPTLSWFAHLGASFHPTAGDSAYNQIKDGVAVGTTLGARFLPLGKSAAAVLQPYIGAEAGYTFLDWGLKDDYAAALGEGADTRDGIAALTVGGEAGVMVRTGGSWTFSLAGRLRRHVSTDMPPNGFSSQAPVITPAATRRFDGGEVGVIARVGIAIGAR